MKVTVYAAALLGAAVISATPAHADLLGQSATATFSGHGADSNLVQFASPQTIGAGTEFTGSFTDVFGGNWSVLLDLDSTGFSVSFTSPPFGNLLSVTGEILRLDLTGLSGLTPIALASYSCPAGLGSCGTGGSGPRVSQMGSDATSAFVGFGVIRTGEIYNFSLANAVPEPASWAMMIAGFGLAGAALRRRPARATMA